MLLNLVCPVSRAQVRLGEKSEIQDVKAYRQLNSMSTLRQLQNLLLSGTNGKTSRAYAWIHTDRISFRPVQMMSVLMQSHNQDM
jgi:hypothetical protein